MRGMGDANAAMIARRRAVRLGLQREARKIFCRLTQPARLRLRLIRPYAAAPGMAAPVRPCPRLVRGLSWFRVMPGTGPGMTGAEVA